MCRTIHGRISIGGEILSGQDEDPALDFSVKRQVGNSETTYFVEFKTPFGATPSLTFTPKYSESVTSSLRQGNQIGSLILISSEEGGFSLFETWEDSSIRPEYFSFSALG
jgi:hypothetical protein